MIDFDPTQVCGWLGSDETQQALAAQMPTLTEAAPHLMMSAPPTEPILLYKAWRDVLGKDPAYPPQQIGDCCSFGHSHGNDLLQCIEIGLGEPIDYRETDTEWVYGASRAIAGILGRQDGSYGAACIKAMTQWGMVSREMLGSDGTYSGSRAKDWGWHGPPSSVKRMAASYKLGAAAAVTSWDELVAAIRNGYPVTECSNFLPSAKRDQDGFVRQDGSGGHCQCIIGVRFDRPGVCIMNSWGPDYYSGPAGLDCPLFAYWIDRALFEKKIAGSGDNWALSKTPAFVKRDLPPGWNYHSMA
jgi:hypothetical protein